MAASSEEKGLLGAATRPHRRYGSTSVNMKKPEHVIKHRVSKQDTLQGIALRYGVTMESIKQHNKLWSGEAMFLHDFLDVPVSRAVFEALNDGSGGAPTLPVNSQTVPHTSSRSSEGSRNNSSTSASTSPTPQSPQQQPQSLPSTPSTPSGLHDCSETDPRDFLSKIDSNIALMKTSIERMETHAYPVIDQMEVDDSQCRNDNVNNSGRWHSATRQNIYRNGYHDPTSAPHPVVAPGRTITMSLKRLLRDHEELYEL